MSVIMRGIRGDEFKFDFTVTKDDHSSFSLDGCHVCFYLKKSLYDNDPPLIKKTNTTGGITILDSAAGKGRVILSPSDTHGLPNLKQHYVFDVKVREPDGSVFTVLQGEIIFKGSAIDESSC